MTHRRLLVLAVAADLLAIAVFVAIGRRNHGAGSAVRDVIETGAPFAIGLAVAWVLVRAWRRPTSRLIGIAIWPITVLVGMIARRALFDRGTATSFVVVATFFLGLTLVGWRMAFAAAAKHRQSSGGALTAR